MKRFLLLVGTLIFAHSELSVSEPLPGIGPHLDFHQVTLMKGSPESTDTREISRLVIWHYRKGDVVFLDGKTVTDPAYFAKPKKGSNVRAVSRFSKPANKTKLSQSDVDEILSAIPNDKGGPAPVNGGVEPGEVSSN